MRRTPQGCSSNSSGTDADRLRKEIQIMENTVKYLISKEMQRESNSQFFLSESLGKKWMVLIPVLLLLWVGIQYGERLIIVASFFSLVLITGAWMVSYIRYRNSGKQFVEILDSKEITLRFNMEDFEMSSETSSTRIIWSKVDSLVETKNYLYPMSGKQALIGLPKAHLSPERIEFIRERTGELKR